MPKVRVKQSAKTEGFAIIGALLIVVAITIMVPQLVSITSEVQTGALKEQSRIKTATISKTIYSSAHAQLIAHTGLPFAWETGTSFGSEPSRVDRAEACFVALYGDLSGAEASMTNWLTDSARFSEIIYQQNTSDNTTYSLSAILFDNGTSSVAQTYEAYQVMGCHVQGLPLPSASAYVGRYAYVGGRLKLLSLFNNSF